jgi:O-antigen/teichoic acid export membrane protein
MTDSSFFKNVLTLFTGSVVSQAIPVLISPILTRQYHPHFYGEYAFYLSIVTILSVAATARYDLSIMIAEDSSTSKAATQLSLLISIFSFVILFACSIVCTIFHLFEGKLLYFYIASINISLIGIYNTFYHRLNRNAAFKMISLSQFVQSLVVAAYQVVSGFFAPNTFNLILGNLFGIAFAVAFIIINDKKSNELIKDLSFEKLTDVAKRFSNFPKFDLWAGLFNIAFQQIPVLLITSIFGAINAGYFSLTQRVLQIPTSLIGGSILGAFRLKAIDEFSKHGNCVNIFIKVFKFMVVVGIIPTLIVLFFGDTIFKIIFGSNWITAGVFSQIMIIMFFAKFITSPLTYMFYIAEKQSWNLIGQIIFIVATLGSFLTGYFYKSITLALVLYTISNTVLYLAYLNVSYLFAKGLYVSKRKD